MAVRLSPRGPRLHDCSGLPRRALAGRDRDDDGLRAEDALAMSVEKDDIIQIAPTHKWGGCLAVVDEPKSFGCLCHVKMPRNDGSVSRAYIRLDTTDYEEIGAKAVFVVAS